MKVSNIIPWVLTLVTVSVGIWQFSTEQTQNNRKPFLERQLEVGFEAVNSVSIMATTTDREIWRKARARFWQLYWGELSVVETPEVEASMIRLGELVPQMEDPIPSLPFGSLQRGSYELTREVRKMLARSWNVELLPPSDQKLQRISK